MGRGAQGLALFGGQLKRWHRRIIRCAMKDRSKSKKVDRAWLNDHVNDPYVKLARQEGYRARAAYKLKEIDEALRLIRPGQVVVDLGSTPGAWSQYVRRRFAPKTAGSGGAAVGALDGTIVALDVLPMEPIEGVLFIEGDFRDEATAAALAASLQGRAVDVVLSDMAPNLSGVAVSDAARMADLVELALHFAGQHLQERRRAGGQGVPWQRLQPVGRALQAIVSGCEGDQAQGVARQVGRDLFGRHRPEAGLMQVKPTPWHANECAVGRVQGDLQAAPTPTLVWTKIVPNCAREAWCVRTTESEHGAGDVRARGSDVGIRSRGEQSMVLEGCGLVGDRTGPVHGLQAVRPRGQPRLADRLLRLPRRGARQAHQVASPCKKATAAPRSWPSPTTTSASAPPPPTSTAAWSVT